MHGWLFHEEKIEKPPDEVSLLLDDLLLFPLS